MCGLTWMLREKPGPACASPDADCRVCSLITARHEAAEQRLRAEVEAATRFVAVKVLIEAEPQQARVVDAPIHNSCTAEVVDGLLMFLRRRWPNSTRHALLSLFSPMCDVRVNAQNCRQMATLLARAFDLRPSELHFYQSINVSTKGANDTAESRLGLKTYPLCLRNLTFLQSNPRRRVCGKVL